MTSNNSEKVVLITGASSGIGLETALALLEKGYRVWGAARHTDMLSEIEKHGGHSLFLDLNDEISIQNCVDLVLKTEGKIDILINNAGFGMGGPLETVSIDEAKSQMQVNVFGMVSIIQKVLPSMREHHFGKIINISSIAGRFSSPYMGWYHASKYSVEALSDALRLEVKPFGIDVSIIEPGLTRTKWGVIAADTIRKHSENSAYENNSKNAADFYDKYYQGKCHISEPTVISKTIVKAICARKCKIRYPIGKYSKLFIFATSIITGSARDALTKLIYKLK